MKGGVGTRFGQRVGLLSLILAWLVVGCDRKDDEARVKSVEELTAERERLSAQSVEELTAERERLDATVFADEVAAQRHEEVFVELWDKLRKEDPFKVFRGFQFDELVLGTASPVKGPNDWGVEGIKPVLLGEPRRKLSRDDFIALLGTLESSGWKIQQTEWHHSRFEPATGDTPARSVVSFEIHAHLRNDTQPLMVRGKLRITWKPGKKIMPGVIEGQDVQLIARKGSPVFSELMVVDPRRDAPRRFPRTSPILVQDLDGDGFSEIVAAGCNLVYWNRGGMRFEKGDFLAHPITRPAEAGILADFTGDGIVDYIGGSVDDGSLLLFMGAEGGSFPHPPLKCFPQSLSHLHALTAGDIDGDGVLDLFVGQWKAPYKGGAMPTPYYDANDGHPDYLLRNEGGGKFTDITSQSGLAALRNRRTFSASFLDLDGDDDLDLAVVADFSGLDLYRNRGDGTFENATATMVDQRHGFGMSHTFDDWNGDGNLDLYMVGMSSTTARRLDGLGLGRKGFEDYSRMRAPMAYGNRLYLGDGQGKFSMSPLAESASRTGWSWGCTSRDFDLDGDPDLYVANGHLSGSSAKDYCTRFWCHDVYTGNSKPDPLLDDLFTKELGLKLGREFSWNGFEHNVLYLNQPGAGFLNVGFLLGVGFEYDSRAVISDDLDADGRPDLLVVEYRTDTQSQRLRVYRNNHESDRHWIGIRVGRLAAAKGESVHGAVVTARAGEQKWTKPVVTGDSFTAQHSSLVHFGLGEVEAVDALVIRWPSGKETEIENPEVDRYH